MPLTTGTSSRRRCSTISAFGNKQGVDGLRLQGNNLLLRDIIQNIDDTVQHVAALEQLHQFAGPLHRRRGSSWGPGAFSNLPEASVHPKRQSGLANGRTVGLADSKTT